ncbi:hypothetical protein K4749_01400 [Streptomyces sp. TRM72054]|uniref:hypothetical protein n=1 Tax=Streptomyces sp. TRM72054 TaxID=2870562 RepID=UPI001C8B6CD7|nr:hypothetical protein [Streptomyces sp. TRM72054]MBX9392287.1 hypothetical protein [Streptomyces sp. TRM72054]
MAFSVWRAGQTITATDLDEASMIGALVFHAERTTTQSISSGSDTVANAVSWNGVTYDVLGGWSSGNPTRWTAPQDGWWIVMGGIGFNSSSGGTIREAVWYLNGALSAMGRARTYTSSSIAASPLTVEARTVPFQLSAGDYLELVPAQNSGAALDTATGSFRPYMSITYAGPA